ncbi:MULTISPECIES: Sec-independent protein translocase family protein [unclassified Phycicoccus]|uniref:twin-arginine translocase TatA/TatE family subunit n=1 Tax=unclassified Phycicoccus TaxID=2637926 RepID=UPI0007029665|nr:MULTISPECIES: twin-arginine translocase TatA/TatE family subunit [unclassified Phycicoccus]KQU70833.1 preprotein translocase subunit TatA [Phycicoccus sp. Root101]KQZ89123.1 preprotein translocase subunit TatA [Phycicoccus sp. Root563]
MMDINGWEFIALIVLAVVILGPERLPEYAAKLGQFVRQARSMAEGAKGQLREQMGPEFDDINWKQYDPRQYDPRRIVREALMEPDADDDHVGSTAPDVVAHDPSRATPYDVDAT